MTLVHSHRSLSGLPEAAPAAHAWGSAPATDALRDLVRWLGGDAAALERVDGSAAVAVRRVGEDVPLVHAGSPAPSLFIIRSGSFKCVKLLEDGYEQMLSLAYPGDVLGFDALCSGRHRATVVALEVSTVFALPLQGLQALRLQCPALDDALQIALSRQLVRCAELTEILAAVASDVRMARFLLWMAARMAERGQSPRRLLLRMCRRDIASLLGVAHETVSRSFTTMAEAGFIRVDNRQVEIVDRAGLQLRARTTPGGPEVCAAAPQRSGAGPVARAPVAWFSSLEQGARVQA